MRWQCPAGFRHYADVLVRVAPEYRTAGESVQFRCPFGERHRNGDRRPSAWAKIGHHGELVCRCSACGAGWRDFQDYCGLPPPAWFPRNTIDPGRAATCRRPKLTSRIVAEYPYTHWQTGELLAVKLRWEPGFTEGAAKDFSWRIPLPAKYRRMAKIPDDQFAWCNAKGMVWCGGRGKRPTAKEYTFASCHSGVWYYRPTVETDQSSFLVEPVEVGIYREWEARQSDRAVFVVEGEGKADLLNSLGFCAVSSPAGKGKWERDYGQLFNARYVVVIPDRDPVDAGLSWSESVIGSAIGWGAVGVSQPLVPRDGVPDDKTIDVKDWLLAMPADTRAARLKSLVSSHKMYKRGI